MSLGKFVRNAPYTHVRNGKTVRFSSPTQFMAQRKETIDEAYPGDIVGLPDNGIFKIGDTLTEANSFTSKDCHRSLLKCSNTLRMLIQ